MSTPLVTWCGVTHPPPIFPVDQRILFFGYYTAFFNQWVYNKSITKIRHALETVTGSEYHFNLINLSQFTHD